MQVGAKYPHCTIPTTSLRVGTQKVYKFVQRTTNSNVMSVVFADGAMRSLSAAESLIHSPGHGRMEERKRGTDRH